MYKTRYIFSDSYERRPGLHHQKVKSGSILSITLDLFIICVENMIKTWRRFPLIWNQYHCPLKNSVLCRLHALKSGQTNSRTYSLTKHYKYSFKWKVTLDQWITDRCFGIGLVIKGVWGYCTPLRSLRLLNVWSLDFYQNWNSMKGPWRASRGGTKSDLI